MSSRTSSTPTDLSFPDLKGRSLVCPSGLNTSRSMVSRGLLWATAKASFIEIINRQRRLEVGHPLQYCDIAYRNIHYLRWHLGRTEEEHTKILRESKTLKEFSTDTSLKHLFANDQGIPLLEGTMLLRTFAELRPSDFPFLRPGSD